MLREHSNPQRAVWGGEKLLVPRTRTIPALLFTNDTRGLTYVARWCREAGNFCILAFTWLH